MAITKRIRYVHGYGPEELDRLAGSAATLQPLLHGAIHYPAGALVLEAGCGVGAQTRFLLEHSPGIRLVSVDLSRDALKRARAAVGQGTYLSQADLYRLPFAPRTFDHIFVCFVLEHLADPLQALHGLKRLLKPGGTLTAIEGDHGSAFFHPETPEAVAAWRCLQRLQLQTSGDGHIGRRLYALLHASGAADIQVAPLPVYCDPSRPEMMDGFADKTIVGMLRGIEQEALAQNMIAPDTWRKGLDDLIRLSKSDDGTFMYTFFRAIATYDGEAGSVSP